MGHRRIEGSKHIRRKLKTKAKIAISVAVLAVVTLSGYLFTEKTDAGNKLKEEIAQISEIGQSRGNTWLGAGPGGAGGTAGSIIMVSAEAITYDSLGNKVTDGNPGYVSGLGGLQYGGTGNSTVIKAKPAKGYEFLRWEKDGVEGTISTSTDLTVKYGDAYGFSGSELTITESTNFVAVFKKIVAVGATPNAASADFYFDMYPAMGTQKLAVKCYECDEDDFADIKMDGHAHVYVFDRGVEYVKAKVTMPLTEAMTAFPHDMKTYTSTSPSGSDSYSYSYPTDVYIRGAFYVYIKKGENVIERKIERNVTVSNLSSSDDTQVEFVFDYPSSEWGVTDYDPQGENLYIKIVPITQQGNSYQVITQPADNKGTTSGDSSSGKPFTTTIKALPYDSYEFDYWSKSGLNGEQLKINGGRDLSVKCDGIEIYTAHFKDAKFQVTANNILPSDGGTITGTGEYGWHDNADLTITPAPGYRIENWSYTTAKGGTHSGSTDTIHIEEIEEDINITVKFTNGKARIDVKASPVNGGSVTVENKTNSKGKKTDYEEFIPGEENAELIASPSDTDGDGTLDYTFLYWMDSKGKKYLGSPLTPADNLLNLKNVASSETYTAYFAPAEIKIDTDVYPKTDASGSPVNAGSVMVTGDTVDDYDPVIYPGVYKAKPNTSVTIKATEGSGYHFQKFTDNYGNEYSSNPLIKSDLTQDTTFTAVFVEDTFDITAIATPITGGHVNVRVGDDTTDPGREGSNTVKYNDKVTLIAKANANYEFKIFEDQYGKQYMGKVNDQGTPDDPTDDTVELTFNAVNGAETYKAIFAMKTVTYNIDVDPDTLEDGTTNYKAGGYEITYKKSPDGTDSGPVKRFVKDSFTDIKGQTDVKIRAIEQNGYHFVRFVNSQGQSFTENPLIMHDVVESDDITIIFAEDDLTVNVVVSPDKGGTATANGKAGTSKVKYGELVNINAIANPGYMFRYFEDQDGNHYEGVENADGSHTYSFEAVNASTTFKAIFVPELLSLEMIYDPDDTSKCGVVVTYQSPSGELNVTDPARNKIDNIVGMTDLKIKAVEKSGYKFLKFVDGTGRVYNDNPLVLPNITENQKITAIFIEEHWKIDVKSSPETGGRVTINDIEGGLEVDYGQHVKIEAKPNEGYKFLYFKDSLGNEYMSNPLELDVINGSETFTAYFAKNDVNITIGLAPEGSGTVKFNSEPAVSSEKTYPTSGLTNVVLTATPKNDYKFLYWKDQDGNTYPDNPLVIVNITRDLKFTAIFDDEYDTIRAIASPASGGKITKIINDDGSITLIAKANRGYTFLNWKKPKGRTYSYKFTIPADQVKAGDTYIANFKINPDYDAKSDITKEQFYREWRKVNTPNYTVTRDYMKLLAMESVAGLRQYNDATPGLRNYNALADARAYFDSKTGETVKKLDLVFGDNELISAENDVLTPDLLPDSDKYLAIAENFTDKKFGKKYDTEILTVKRVLEPDDFNNKKRTYLWRYTGAEYKDNIYLLYGINDNKPEYVTPIVDEDGVLKFTINKLENNDVVAVVRVKIKN